MCTNDSSSGRKRKISLPMCLPSNKRSWRDTSSFGTHHNTTAELRNSRAVIIPWAMGACATTGVCMVAGLTKTRKHATYTEDLRKGNIIASLFFSEPNIVVYDVLPYSTALYHTITASIYIAPHKATRDGVSLFSTSLDCLIRHRAVFRALRACYAAPYRLE